MQIEAYFQQIRHTLEACPVVQASNVTYDKRTTHTGFIRGELHLIDDSVLHIREFVDVETTVEKLMYVYHYMDGNHRLIFRYDDTGHHKKLNLPTYPHHKHVGYEDNVIAASSPDLRTVLEEIELTIHLDYD